MASDSLDLANLVHSADISRAVSEDMPRHLVVSEVMLRVALVNLVAITHLLRTVDSHPVAITTTRRPVVSAVVFPTAVSAVVVSLLRSTTPLLQASRSRPSQQAPTNHNRPESVSEASLPALEPVF